MREQGVLHHSRQRLVWALFVLVSSAAVATSTVASYGVRAATVLAVAALLLRQASRRDGLSRARRLLAGAMLAGAASGAGAAVQAMVTGAPGAVGSWSDCLQLLYIPFGVAGLVTIPATRAARFRTITDAAVAAGSLWYVTIAVVVEPRHLGADLPVLAQAVTLGYLLGPPLVIALLLSLVGGTTGSARPFVVRSAWGMALVSAADVAFAMASWRRGYDPASWIAALQQAGLAVLLLGVASTRAAGRWASRSSRSEGSGGLEVLLPYAPLLVALSVAAAQFAGGGGFTRAQTLPVMLTAAAVVVRHGAAVHAHASLVRDLERRERAARRAALRDPLTGLANRAAFVDRLTASLADPAAHPVAVAVLDLNDFKHINDNHGHETGDRLLRTCGTRLAAAVGAAGCVARLGGDEFAVYETAAHDGGRRLMEALTSAFEEPVVIGRRPFVVRPSVGVVADERTPGRAEAGDAAQLLAHADVAMYQAKADKALSARPAVRLAGAAREQAAALIALRDEISQPALEQFGVLYQPVVHLATGRVVGVEALLRWRHPTFGDVSPAQFVPLAEQVGSIATLGRHALVTALADLARWDAASSARLTVGVNVSPRELTDPGFAIGVLRSLARHGVSSDRLTVEITEGALMRDLDLSVRIVADLRAAGIAVAVDDFGTGHSSLQYLRRFAADTIKIDQEFIKALPWEPRTAILVRSVLEMSAALGLQAVAEGIESPAHLRAVRELGCQLGQGFLFSAPLDAGAIAELVAAEHRGRVPATAGGGLAPAPTRPAGTLAR